MGYAVRQGGGSGIMVECEPDVVLNDYVYLSSSEKAGRAKADSVNTMPSVGYVTRLLSNNRCIINQFQLEKNLTGLTPKQRFFISPTDAGQITNIAPSDPDHVLQCVAEAKSETEILISIDPTNYVIRQ